MIWNKLIDRCMLFTDSPGGLIKALLREAEQELSNKLEIYDALYTIKVPNTLSGLGLSSQSTDTAIFDTNYTKLPEGYLKDVGVIHKGIKLRKMSEEEIYRHGNDNEISSGTPTGYAISGNFILFNTIPAVGDKFLLQYKATLGEATNDKAFTILDYDVTVPRIWLDTALGALLDGLKIKWETELFTLSAGGISQFPSHIPGLPDKGAGNEILNNLTSTDLGVNMSASQYTISGLLGSGGVATSVDTNGVTAPIGSMCRIINYRSIAPLIPDRFHINLCDYAIALANAKISTDIYDKYLMKWELNMERLDNEARDRDLIYSVREEI